MKKKRKISKNAIQLSLALLVFASGAMMAFGYPIFLISVSLGAILIFLSEVIIK